MARNPKGEGKRFCQLIQSIEAICSIEVINVVERVRDEDRCVAERRIATG